VTSATAPDPPRAPGLSIIDRRRAFVVSFGETVRACSWAIVHGGIVDTDHVAWIEVTNAELGPAVDARQFLRERLRREGVERAVGLLTSRAVASRIEAVARVGDVTATCIATVGLGNALRAGDSPWPAAVVGTINVLAHADVPLSDEALVEATAIATEAKTAALFDRGVPSRRSRALATGTGTDCTIAACPRTAARDIREYAGKHTEVGAALGNAVGRAIRDGIDRWRLDVGA
jgi:adenosylcobinamide amidohydrolase